MKPAQSFAPDNVVHLSLWGQRPDRAAAAADATLAELRELWPNVVDLAKQPGILYRLHAMLAD